MPKQEYPRDTAIILLLLMISCIFLLFPAITSAGNQEQSPEKERVLIINSYHIGYKWSDEIMAAIRQTFASERPATELYFEFLDTAHFPEPTYWENMFSALSAKYSMFSFNLIIASDNNALDFIRMCRFRFQPQVPVVFCGVNFYDPGMIIGQKNITGVAEQADFKATADLAFRLHPKAEQFVFITGTTHTSIANTKKFNDIRPDLESRIDVEIWQEPDDTKVLQATPDDVLFLIGSPRYIASMADIAEYGKHLSALSRAPVYSSWDFLIGTGIIGGFMLNGADQGKAAASLALKILRGTPADSIPVITETPGGDQELLYRLIKGMPQYLSGEMQKLNIALKENDAEAVRLYAHTIKGSCANIAAHRMADAAYLIEKAGKEGNTELAASLAEKLEKEFQMLESAISIAGDPIALIKEAVPAICRDAEDTADDIFDCQSLMNWLGTDEAYIRSFINDLPKHISDEIDALKTAMNNTDNEKIRLHAHKLKGMCGNVGAHRLSAAARGIEAAAKDGGKNIDRSLTERLEEEFLLFQSAVSDMFPETSEAEETLPENMPEYLSEMIRRLKAEMVPIWEEITEMFFVDEISSFAEKLKQIAEEYHSDALAAYSRKLAEAVRFYDVDEMEKFLAAFPTLIERIEN